MNTQLVKHFGDVMFETCRDQMEEVKNYNGADAGEKIRRCFNKFYILVRHQNEYYDKMPKEQFEELMKI